MSTRAILSQIHLTNMSHKDQETVRDFLLGKSGVDWD